jgi:hypothetical protein
MDNFSLLESFHRNKISPFVTRKKKPRAEPAVKIAIWKLYERLLFNRLLCQPNTAIAVYHRNEVGALFQVDGIELNQVIAFLGIHGIAL